MTRRKTNGLIAAPFTPMHADGALNLEAIDGYAGWLHGNGVVGAFICGTTGEGTSLTLEERRQVAARWVAVAPSGLRVIVHVGGNSLADCRALTAHAASLGADSVACMAPFFFKIRNVAELVEWCAEVASAAPQLPFYYYHIPSMTGASVPVAEFLAAAANRIPNLVGVKYTFEDLEDYARCLRFADGRYDVLFGRDELLLSALSLGARGAVGSTYNFAAPQYRRLIDAFSRGDQRMAAVLQAQAVQMIDDCVKSGAHPIAAFKWLMSRVGLDCGPTRLPLMTITAVQAKALAAKLDALKDFSWNSREAVATRAST
ncbi:MAG: dihydrodipicolinate synthase family protein [Opitutaceae bacterium]|nr:dihydrodipicolinate synthase family protein [Opitutaceae bacterium]